MVTRNKSVSATTLHTAMNLHMMCMQKGEHLDVHFVDNLLSLAKLIKTGERIFWMDYGTNLDVDSLKKVICPFENNLQVLVFPSVVEGIDWAAFETKTKAGSTEPAGQRGLSFDTEVGKKLANGIYECATTSARVWVMDSKPVDRKLRGEKNTVRLPTSTPEMFRCLKNMGIKIGVVSDAIVICHFIHECFGNILEASGIQLGP